MKIVLLQGSPNKNGSTNILAENFSKGAKEAGHDVIRFDVADMNMKPCTGCVACGYDRICNAALLLWNVSTTENRSGSLLCI